MIVELEKKIKLKQSQFRCCEREYDEFLIEGEDLREKRLN